MATAIPTRDQVIARLKSAEPRIRALSVRSLALFGSVVRGQARPDSDVDLLVQFDPERKTLENFMSLCVLLEDLLAHPVEVVTTESLSPYIGPHILRQAEDVLLAA